jgi:hypothetical protein
MNGSSLEITENEYCIKLNKDVFKLSLVHQLIKRIQAEELFFNRKDENCEEDFNNRSATSVEFEENFDHLDDK